MKELAYQVLLGLCFLGAIVECFATTSKLISKGENVYMVFLSVAIALTISYFIGGIFV